MRSHPRPRRHPLRAIIIAVRRLMGSRVATSAWERIWAARKTALEKLFGPAGERVRYGAIPFPLGGDASVLEFPRHIVGGTLYVTAELTGPLSAQAVNDRRHQYELAICVRSEQTWAPDTIRRLAQYCISRPLNDGETVNLMSAVPPASEMSSFLFVDYGEFVLCGQRCDVLLCLGITDDELQACYDEGTTVVLERLRGAGVFPFTDLERDSGGDGVA